MRRKILVLCIALLVIGGILAARWIARPPRARASSQFAVLDHQCQSLASLLAIARVRPLVAPHPILFVIDESVVHGLIAANLPFEQVIAKRYLIHVNSAAVQFADGFSWIRLDCRASLVDHSMRDASAEISVYGGLEIVGVDHTTGALLGHVTVFSVDARKVALLQMDAPVERLIDDLAKVQLEKFGSLLTKLEIPVQLDQVITLPRLGPHGGVNVPALSLPVSASIEDVKAFRGRLWIAVSVNSDTLHAAASAPAQRAPLGVPRLASSRVKAAAESFVTHGRARMRRFHLSLRMPALLRREGPIRSRAVQPQLAALLLRRAALHDSLEAAIGDDPLIREALADSGNVLVAVQSSFLIDTMRRVLDSYFDCIQLSLHLHKQIHEDGELRVHTPLGNVVAGKWAVDLLVQSISGTLRTRTPRLTVTRANHLDVAVPVHLEKGRGSGQMTFDWDSRTLVSAVCGDFEVSEALAARVLPGDYMVHGGFDVVARGTRLVAVPEFPQEKYRIMVDLEPASWQRVRNALAVQASAPRCGTVLRPEKVLERLREIEGRGFSVSLPRSLFRPVELPVAISQSVQVEDRQVKLAVTPLALRVTPKLFWYSARATASGSGAASPSGPGTTH